MAERERERRKGERGVWGAASARPTARKRKSVVGGSHLNERVVPVTPAPGLLLAPVPIELGARDHETARELPPGRDDPPCGKNNPGDASCLRGRVLHATASGVTKSSPPRGGGVQQAASRRQTQQHMPFSASLLLLCLEPRNAYLEHNRRRRVCGRGIANQPSKTKTKTKTPRRVSWWTEVRFGRKAEDPSGDKNRTAREKPRALCCGWLLVARPALLLGLT